MGNYTKAKEPGFSIGDRVYSYQPEIQAGVTSKFAKKWIGPYRITHLRGVRGKADHRTTRDSTSTFGHPRKATATTEPPGDFTGPITRTQELLIHQGPRQPELRQLPEWKGTTLPNLERTTNSGRRSGRFGTEFGDGWRGLFTLASWNQEGGLPGRTEQLRRPQANLKKREYLLNSISQQGRSLVSQDLVVFKFQ
ncbi:hypothetical protein JTB14_014290 [Gonioctena quinquepunctata]|nr:hypothetical protein JTB14_014290 [Gonioctena quinquepunctata]